MLITNTCLNPTALGGFSSVAESVTKWVFPRFLSSKLILDGVMDNTTASLPGKLIAERSTIATWSSARSLLKHAGKWRGDDLEQCIREVYAARAQTDF